MTTLTPTYLHFEHTLPTYCKLSKFGKCQGHSLYHYCFDGMLKINSPIFFSNLYSRFTWIKTCHLKLQNKHNQLANIRNISVRAWLVISKVQITAIPLTTPAFHSFLSPISYEHRETFHHCVSLSGWQSVTSVLQQPGDRRRIILLLWKNKNFF